MEENESGESDVASGEDEWRDKEKAISRSESGRWENILEIPVLEKYWTLVIQSISDRTL